MGSQPVEVSPHVLVVGSHRPELSALISARPAGSVAAITEPAHAAAFEAAGADVATVRSRRDLGAVVSAAERVAEQRSLAGVVAATEGSVLAGGAVRSRLDLPGLDFDGALAVTHKTAMKRRAERHGLPVVPYAPMDDVTQLEAIGDRVGWPVIVKPSMGAGTQYMTIVRNPREAAAWRAATGAPDLAHVPGNAWHVERCIDVNAEWHCDGVVSGGRVRFASVARYLDPVLHCVGRVFGSRIRLPGTSEWDLIIDLHARAVRAFRLQDAVTHLEILGSGGRLYFGEMAARVGGGPIADMVRESWGVDLWDALWRVSSGAFEKLEPRADPRLVGWVGTYGGVGLAPALRAVTVTEGVAVRRAAAASHASEHAVPSTDLAATVVVSAGDDASYLSAARRVPPAAS